MMGIGFPELMVILGIIMIIFGAGKLPEIGSAFGRSIKNFKGSMKEAEAEELETETSSETAPGTTTESTEPVLVATRKIVTPIGGVDVTPIIWVGLSSLFRELFLGQQGLITQIIF